MSFFLPLVLLSPLHPLALPIVEKRVVPLNWQLEQGLRSELAAAISAAIEDKRLEAGFVGVCVAEEKTGKILFERNADHVFIPASNNKLLTAFAIMESSPERVFRTRVARTGTLSPDGYLTGSLVLLGDGDPSLTPEKLHSLVKFVKDAGIQSVDRVQYDESAFDIAKLGDSWSWDDEPFYYSAQVSALNCNENLVKVIVTAKRGRFSVTLVPPSRELKIVNLARLLSLKEPITKPLLITRRRGENVIEITGQAHEADLIKTPVTEELTVENPAHFTASLFQTALSKAGIRTRNGVSEVSALFSQGKREGLQILGEVTSEPLSKLLSLFLKPSDNLYGECFLKTVGRDPLTQREGSIAGGVKATEPKFVEAGLDLSRLHIVDGSGLSTHNFVSPRNLVKLLTYVQKRPYFSAFYEALPIAGIDGSLRNRMKETPAAANVHAKTGTLAHASSLSGYVTTKSGTRLVFSILMNHYLCAGSVTREVQDKIAVLLASYGGE